MSRRDQRNTIRALDARVQELKRDVDRAKGQRDSAVAARDEARAQRALAWDEIPYAARPLILAVVLMLKNRNDAAPVAEGAHVEAVQAEYARIAKFREMLGPVSDEEMEAATALWEQTAT